MTHDTVFKFITIKHFSEENPLMSFYRAVFRLLSDSIAEFSKDNSGDLIPEWYPTFGEHLFNSSTLRKDVLRGTESSLSGG